MNLGTMITSWTFTLPALGALGLLAIHAVKTHGWLFLVIWLILPALIVANTNLALVLPNAPEVWLDAQVIFPGTADAAIFLVAAFYLSALLAKGFVERSRFAGSPFALATIAGGVATLFALVIESSNRGYPERIAYVVDDGCRAIEGSRLGFAMGSGFPASFAASVFFFAFAYRWISIATPRNGVKLVALAALSPAIVAGACWIGRIFF